MVRQPDHNYPVQHFRDHRFQNRNSYKGEAKRKKSYFMVPGQDDLMSQPHVPVSTSESKSPKNLIAYADDRF
ncbi:MAG: hypothetical protein ACJARR_002596 [Pseudophaeobacter arcticus]|jgi:hypothetical protein